MYSTGHVLHNSVDRGAIAQQPEGMGGGPGPRGRAGWNMLCMHQRRMGRPGMSVAQQKPLQAAGEADRCAAAVACGARHQTHRMARCTTATERSVRDAAKRRPKPALPSTGTPSQKE